MPSKSPYIMVRTTKETIKKFEVVSEYNNRSMSNMGETIIKEYIRKFEEEHGEIIVKEE